MAIQVFQADMVAFHLARRFSTILLPCNTLSTLGADRRQATFRCVQRHLQPGGLFVASLPNPEALLRLPARSRVQEEEFFFHPSDGEPVQVSSAWQRSARRFRLTWHYDRLFPDGRVDRYSVHVEHHLEKPSTYIEELHSAGLELKESFGNYDQTSYTAESEYLILVASRY